MSLKKKAAQVRAAGHKNSRQDSMLAHITPEEAAFLKRGGGSGRKDPKTGLPHYEGFGDSDTGGFSNAGYGAGFAGGYGDAMGGGFTGEGALSDVGMDTSGFTDSYGYSPDYSSYDSAPLSDLSSVDVNSYGPVTNVQAGTPAIGAEETPFEDQLARKAKALAMSQVASKLGIPGPAMGLMNTAMAKNPQDQARAFGELATGIGLSAIGGPLGLAIGASPAGRAVGDALAGFENSRTDAARAAASAATGRGSLGAGGFDLGGTLTGLAGLYQGNKAAQSTKQAANVAQQQTQQLADLYGPNSPYAAQLRQQLERKDAAAGRRSQYGPREVELQARLADVASRNAPNVLAANQQAQTLRQQGQTTRGQQLAGVLALANKTGLTGMAQRGLSGLYDNYLGSGGGTTGNEGFSLGGMSYNNPSAYTAPSAGFEWPSAQGAYDYAADVGNNVSSFWE